MGSIYKRKRTRAIPENAVNVTKRGKTFAEWETKRGRKYRLPYTEDGKRLEYESKTYYIQYIDENGLKKIEPTGAVEIDVARQILKAKERRAIEIREGIVDPAAERIKEAAAIDMDEHVKKFAQSLTDKGRGPKHVDMTEQHVTQAVESLGWDRVNKMRSEDAQEYLSGLNDKHGEPLSARTKNAHLTSLKAFSGWLYKTKRASTHELRSLTTFAKDEGRHQRRVLSNEEMTRLLNAAADGPNVQSVPGQTRAMLYLLASATGYRRKELSELKPESFDLDGQTPTVSLGATSTKNKKAAVQPIPPQVADLMRGFLQGIEAGLAVFPLKRSGGGIRRTSRMMQVDLELARAEWIEEAKDDLQEVGERTKSDFLKYKDSLGEMADLHSLRHRYVTELARAGVPITLAKELARHSDVRLTADIYSHVDLTEKAAAVNRITFDAGPEGKLNGRSLGSTEAAFSVKTGPLLTSETKVSVEKSRIEKREKPYKTRLLAQKKPVVKTTGSSSGAGIRTPDTRIMIPRTNIGNPNSRNRLDQGANSRCTHRCTTVEIDRDLANFIVSWPTLEQTQQQALLTLAGASRVQSGGLPLKQMESSEAPQSSVPNPLYSTAKTFSSPSHKELFSESEWQGLIHHLALPERQADILYLLLHGKNDKQIARKLKISQPTLRTHLQRMYGRFNVPNRTSLVIKLVRFARGLT